MDFTEDLPLLVPGHMMIYGDPLGATQAINIPFVKYVAGDKLHITRIDTVYLVLSTTNYYQYMLGCLGCLPQKSTDQLEGVLTSLYS